jgi:acyl carrier protein
MARRARPAAGAQRHRVAVDPLRRESIASIEEVRALASRAPSGWNMAITRQALLDYLKTELRVDVGKIDDHTLLFSSSLIDSFSMIELIGFIEKTCHRKVEAMDVNLDNFDSVNRILAYTSRIEGG